MNPLLEGYPSSPEQRIWWLKQRFNCRVNAQIALHLARLVVKYSITPEIHEQFLNQLEEFIDKKNGVFIHEEEFDKLTSENFLSDFTGKIKGVREIRLPYYAAMVFWDAFSAVREQFVYPNSGLVANFTSRALSYYADTLRQEYYSQLKENFDNPDASYEIASQRYKEKSQAGQQHATSKIKQLLNLFLPIDTWKPQYHTNTTTELAKVIYQTKNWAMCKILADALMDAGCEDNTILELLLTQNHLFGVGVWIIDQLAGVNNGR